MKKTICILLCLTVIFTLSACIDNSISTTVNQEQTALSSLPTEYGVIINNIIKSYPWNDDETNIVPENPELSYMYRRNSSLSEIGFALIDLDGNGQEELIVSDITTPFVYDLYTISNGQATHLFGSHERNACYVYQNGYIENQWSGSAATTGHDFYKLNDGNFDFIERIAMDAYHAMDVGLIKDLSEATEENSFFRSKSDKEDDYKSATFDDAMKTIETYQNANKPLKFEYVLLSEYNK